MNLGNYFIYCPLSSTNQKTIFRYLEIERTGGTNYVNRFPVYLTFEAKKIYIAFGGYVGNQHISTDILTIDLKPYQPRNADAFSHQLNNVSKLIPLHVYYPGITRSRHFKQPPNKQKFCNVRSFYDGPPMDKHILNDTEFAISTEKIFLDMLFDLFNSSVFEIDPYANQIKDQITTHYVANAIVAKQTYQYRKNILLEKFTEAGNKPEDITKIYFDKYWEAEAEWMNSLLNENSYYIFEITTWFYSSVVEVKKIAIPYYSEQEEGVMKMIRNTAQKSSTEKYIATVNESNHKASNFFMERFSISDALRLFYISRRQFCNIFIFLAAIWLGVVLQQYERTDLLTVIVTCAIVVTLLYRARKREGLILILLALAWFTIVAIRFEGSFFSAAIIACALVVGLFYSIIIPGFLIIYRSIPELFFELSRKYLSKKLRDTITRKVRPKYDKLPKPYLDLSLFFPYMSLGIIAAWGTYIPISEEAWELSLNFDSTKFMWFFFILAGVTILLIYSILKFRIPEFRRYGLGYFKSFLFFFFGISFSILCGLFTMSLNTKKIIMDGSLSYVPSEYLTDSVKARIENYHTAQTSIHQFERWLFAAPSPDTSRISSVNFKEKDSLLAYLRSANNAYSEKIVRAIEKDSTLGYYKKHLEKDFISMLEKHHEPEIQQSVKQLANTLRDKTALPYIAHYDLYGISFFYYPRLLLLYALISFFLGYLLEFFVTFRRKL